MTIHIVVQTTLITGFSVNQTGEIVNCSFALIKALGFNMLIEGPLVALFRKTSCNSKECGN